MENKSKNQFGSGDAFSDWAAVIIALLLFVRTMDVLSYFSPPVLNDIIGADVSWLYGATSAFFIEGVALAYHFNRRAQTYTPAKIVKWMLLAISGVCQIFDGRLITGTLANMPPAQKLVFEIGVPVLPLVVLVLLFFVGRLPEDDEYRPGWKGIRNIAKGKLSYFLDGDASGLSNLSQVQSLPAPAPVQNNPQNNPVLAPTPTPPLTPTQSQVSGNGHGGQQGSNFP